MPKPVAFYKAMNPSDEPEATQAQAHAASIGGSARYFRMGEKIPGLGNAAEAGWMVWPAPSQSSGGGGGGSVPPPPSRKQAPGTPSKAAPGAQAMLATMASQPTITGGGQGFSIGAVQVGTTIPQRSEDFHGIDSLTPDNKLNANHAPRGINWDSFRRVGSRSPRAGVAKLADDRDTVTASGGGAISSEYRGLSILALPASGAADDKLLLVFHDKDIEIGVAPGGSNSLTSFHIVTTDPRWGRPRNLTDLPGPTVTLTDQGSGVMRVNVVYTNVFPTARAELMKQSVKGVIIRYAGPVSGATPRYPLDPDGDSAIGTDDGTGSTLFKNRTTTWDGTSTNYDTGTLTLGKYWVSVWATSLEGISAPTFRSITIA